MWGKKYPSSEWSGMWGLWIGTEPWRYTYHNEISDHKPDKDEYGRIVISTSVRYPRHVSLEVRGTKEQSQYSFFASCTEYCIARRNQTASDSGSQ